MGTASQVPKVFVTDANGDAIGGLLGGSSSVTVTPSSGALTDRSGTITVGGTAQNAMSANTSRKYLFVRNPTSATEPLYFNFTTAAVAASPSIRLDAGESFVMEGSFVTTEAISVIAATTAHAFTAKEG